MEDATAALERKKKEVVDALICKVREYSDIFVQMEKKENDVPQFKSFVSGHEANNYSHEFGYRKKLSEWRRPIAGFGMYCNGSTSASNYDLFLERSGKLSFSLEKRYDENEKEYIERQISFLGDFQRSAEEFFRKLERELSLLIKEPEEEKER